MSSFFKGLKKLHKNFLSVIILQLQKGETMKSQHFTISTPTTDNRSLSLSLLLLHLL